MNDLEPNERTVNLYHNIINRIENYDMCEERRKHIGFYCHRDSDVVFVIKINKCIFVIVCSTHPLTTAVELYHSIATSFC